MRLDSAKLSLVLIAALLMGAAISAPAQKRGTRKSAARRVPATATPAAAIPESSKENARAEEPPAETPASADSAPEPAKKNAGARPSAEFVLPAGTGLAPPEPTDDARYFYEFSQPSFEVSHIRIEHDSAGRGRITFERKGDGAPITDPLEIAPAAFARIIAAWEALRFLDSTAAYQSDKQFPNLGTVRLLMKRGARERSAEFNWTNNETAAALAREYRHLAEQQLFVFDINVARQYQPSETVKLLRRLEVLLDRNEVSDPAQLAPLLTDLSTDERIPLIARNQAGRLLKKVKK